MTVKTVFVPNISCGHCTHTIEMEVGDIEGVQRVSADQESRRVTIEWKEPATWESISALMTEINYPPAEPVQEG